MSDKFSGVRVVTALSIEMRERLITLAGPRAWSDTRESWLARGARRAGITYRTAKSLFYCETPDPKSSVVERVRAATAEQEANNARKEYAELCGRIARLEATVALQNPHADRADLDERFGAARGFHRPVD